MAKYRCSLCDGRLDSNNRCTFCGLDNTKSDRYYRLNQSNCDDASFTHAHEDDGSVRGAKRIVRQGSTMNGTGNKKTIHEADWEINRKQASKKYQDMNNQRTNARTSASSYTTSGSTGHGINSDDYADNKKRVRVVVIIIIVIMFLLQGMTAVVEELRYSPEIYTFKEKINSLFGGSEREQIQEDDEEEVYEYEDGMDEYFNDPDFYDEFIEQFGEEFFDNYDFFGDDFIEANPADQTPSGGKL